MAEVINTRLFFPEDENHRRKVLHPETNSDNVIIDEKGTRLSEVTDNMVHVIRESDHESVHSLGPGIYFEVLDDE